MWVKIGEHTGTVEGMTIRTMRLRDADGQVHTLPFSNVASVINLSRDFGYHVFNIAVAYSEDIDKVVGVIRQVGEENAGATPMSASISPIRSMFSVSTSSPTPRW